MLLRLIILDTLSDFLQLLIEKTKTKSIIIVVLSTALVKSCIPVAEVTEE